MERKGKTKKWKEKINTCDVIHMEEAGEKNHDCVGAWSLMSRGDRTAESADSSSRSTNRPDARSP